MNRSNSDKSDNGNGIPADGSALQKEHQLRGDYRLDALDRILSSKQFRASERNKQFLKFVVEETVAGRSSRIKAFTVAVDVFGRDSSFDASVDPIVRIAAGHLRRSLEEYYMGPGKRDPYRIVLPLGTYVPVFIRQERLPERALGRFRDILARRQGSLQSGAVSATMALVAAVLGAAYFGLPIRDPGPAAAPVIVVAQVQSHEPEKATEDFARLFNQSLWAALSELEGFRVVGVKPDEDLGEILARVDEKFGDQAALYQLLSTVRRDGEELQVFWHLLDGRSNESYLSTSAVRVAGVGRNVQISSEIAQEVADRVRQFSHPKSADPS